VVDFNAGTDAAFPAWILPRPIPSWTDDLVADTEAFSHWINKKLCWNNNCRYGIGGYMEHRTIYTRSAHFRYSG
jgi:hypothetical protein